MRARSLAVALACLFAAMGRAPAQEDIEIPPELEPWRAWVLHDQQHLACPFLSTANPGNSSTARCAWPERLTLDLGANGGTFVQRWQVYAESWVQLPGSLEYWPQDVRVNGEAGAVVARSGVPSVRLERGSYAISGRLTWTNRPEALSIAPEVALVDLRLDGRTVSQPERPNGALWLGKRRSTEQREQMDLQVHRLVEDEIPAILRTHLRIQAAGDAREVVLGPVLPEGLVPLNLTSALAARLEPDGRLRVQVRAGSWLIALAARGRDVASTLERPKVQGAWPQEEIWSFKGNDRLRIAAVEGAEAIDPEQANVPDDWRRFPAFRLPPAGKLTVVERSRGLANADDNRLTLARDLWLDFDHGGLTAVDRIGGTMRRDWRLQVVPPFQLESARAGETNLLVTQDESGHLGVEVRDPTLDITATARVDRARGALPATGWNARFEQASGQLHLPPGHRLLAAFGADQAPTSWIERWGLWGFFGVLVVAVFAGWIAGPLVGAIALVGLLLTYQESAGYIWLWGNLLAAVAVARSAPEGRFHRIAAAYRTTSFVVLGVALLPLLWSELRIALYPQLDAGAVFLQEVPVTAARERGLQAPEPRMEEAARRPPAAAAPVEGDISSVAVAGKRVGAVDQASVSPVMELPATRYYAPGTILQTGPGIPSWQYVVHPYRWSGPVEAGESVRFLYIGPVLLGAWRVASVVLLALLFFALLRASSAARGDPTGGALARTRSGGVRPAVTAAAVLGAWLPAVAGQSSTAWAAATPDAAVLTDLQQRLLRPPRCHPNCIDVMSARVTISGERLDVVLDVSALANAALPAPAAGDRWQLDGVTVDGRGAAGIVREGDGTSFRIPLARGAHVVRLTGRVTASESIQLAFPATPRVVTVASDGWEVAGVNESRLVSGSLELTRRRADGDDAAADSRAPNEFPAFVRVVRAVDLGLDWSVTTTVERIAPEAAAFTIDVPLIAGESVLNEDIEVRERGGTRIALVGLGRGERDVEWSSALPRSERLVLEMPGDAVRKEVWRLRVSPQWNVAFDGFPAVLPEELESDEWIYEFHPRPGEKLGVRVTRPAAAKGTTLAIDSVRQSSVAGKRSSDETLAFSYRSTQGGRHTIVLPVTARVTAVEIDDESVQLRPDKGRLSMELLPGQHRISVNWTMPDGVAARARPSAVDLAAPASNVQTTLQLPANRWALFADGPGIGPVVLYWIEFAVFLATAWLLGSWQWSPLRTHEWLLLGIGLSTFAWGIFVLVALWLFAMRWREGWSGKVLRWQFNLVQLLLAGLTLFAVGALILSGIRESLLGVPDMGVAGPGSGGNTFAWFLDQTESTLPRPSVVSVPMWVYRALMFAWALWIVTALLRWLRWAWQAWKANGIWRNDVVVTA